MISSKFVFFFFKTPAHPRVLLSFPTRRSSDLSSPVTDHEPGGLRRRTPRTSATYAVREPLARHTSRIDRKSTRLNSSHPSISYAVFCLKKKNISDFIASLHYTNTCRGFAIS